jgi:hypothetical protein
MAVISSNRDISRLLAIATAVFIALANSGFANAAVDSWGRTNSGLATAPSVRNGHAFVGGDGQYAYLFGGNNGPLSSTELWRYDHLSATWTMLPATGPAKRKFAGSSFGAGNFVLVGGASGLGLNPYYNDTWTYNESAGRWTAAQKCSAGHPCPAARAGAAMAYDRSRDYHLLYGGSNGSVTFGDTWIYKASTRRWTQAVIPTGTPTPAARWIHAMAYVAPIGQVVMFGGVGRDVLGASVLLPDLWAWDGARWNQVAQKNAGPAVSAMGMAYDAAQGRLVVFGGSMSPVINVLTADTWTFDFARGLWTNLGPTTGLDPRNASPMVYLPKYGVRIFACGLSDGVNGLTNVNDTWESR